MSTTTDKLALFKYDPSTDGAQTFNIQKALNDNWDKLDDAVKEILITLANKAPTVHAGQHAKGGADPITPESIGAAPGGFGLGQANMKTLEDCNNAILSGWYTTDNPTSNTPDEYGASGVLCVSRRFDKRIYQEFHTINGNEYSRWSAARISYGNDPISLQWGPWEYVNPPLMLGTEYRTTERYLGRPVYCKVVDCGNFIADKTVSWYDKLSEISTLVGINVTTNRMTFPDSYVSGDKIVLRGSDPWGGTVYACIKYIKTTV